MIWLKIIGKFTRKYWLPLLLFGAIAFIAVNYHKMSVAAIELEQQNTELLLQVTVVTRQRDMCVGEVQSQNAYIGKLAEKAKMFEYRVMELQNMPPPEKVIEIRETIKEVERGITASDCVDAVAEAARIIKGLNDE